MRDLEGQKNYENSTRTLTKEGFDCKLDGLFGFLESLKARDKSEGWGKDNGILKIPEKDTPANVNDLLKLYGFIPLTEIKDHPDTYMETSLKNAQNSGTMAATIRKSLNEQVGIKMISTWTNFVTEKLKLGH